MGVCGRLKRALRESGVSGPQVDDHLPTYPTLAVQTASVVGARDCIESRERLDQKQGEQVSYLLQRLIVVCCVIAVCSHGATDAGSYKAGADFERAESGIACESTRPQQRAYDCSRGASCTHRRVDGRHASDWQSRTLLRWKCLEGLEHCSSSIHAGAEPRPHRIRDQSRDHRRSSGECGAVSRRSSCKYAAVLHTHHGVLRIDANQGSKLWAGGRSQGVACTGEIPRTYIGHEGCIIAHGGSELRREWRGTGALGDIRSHDNQIREHCEDADTHDLEGGNCPQAAARIVAAATPHLELGVMEHVRAAQARDREHCKGTDVIKWVACANGPWSAWTEHKREQGQRQRAKKRRIWDPCSICGKRGHLAKDVGRRSLGRRGQKEKANRRGTTVDVAKEELKGMEHPRARAGDAGRKDITAKTARNR
eukprot:6492710-Amphidinium_carterae.4